MKLERDTMFRELEPPPGGTARLRARLGQSRDRPSLALWMTGPVAVAALAALVFFAFDSREADEAVAPDDELYVAAAFDRLLGRPSQPLPIRVSNGDEQIAVSEVRTTTPGVRLYALETRTPPTAREDDARP